MNDWEQIPVDLDFAGDAEGFAADSQFEQRFPIEKRPVQRVIEPVAKYYAA